MGKFYSYWQQIVHLKLEKEKKKRNILQNILRWRHAVRYVILTSSHMVQAHVRQFVNRV